MIIKKRKLQLINSINNQLIESVYLNENSNRVYLKIPVSFNTNNEILSLKKVRFYFVKKEFYIKEDFTNSSNLTSSDFYTAKREAKTTSSESKLKIKSKYRDINNVDIFRFNSELNISETDLDIIRFSGSYVFYVPVAGIDQDLTHFRIALLDNNNKTLSYINPVAFDQNRNIEYYVNNAQPEDYVDSIRREIISALNTINIQYVADIPRSENQNLGIADYNFQLSLNQLDSSKFNNLEIFINYKGYDASYFFDEYEENIFLLEGSSKEIEEEIAKNSVKEEEVEDLVITFSFTLTNIEKTNITCTIDKEIPTGVVDSITEVYRKSVSNSLKEEFKISCEISDDESYYSSYKFSVDSEIDLTQLIVRAIKINGQEINKISTQLNQRDIEKTNYKNQSIRSIVNKRVFSSAAIKKNIIELIYSIMGEEYIATFNITSKEKNNYSNFYAEAVKEFYSLFSLNTDFIIDKNKNAKGIENYNILSSKIRNIDTFTELARKFGYIASNGEVQTNIFLKNTMFGIQVNLYINNNYVHSKEGFCFLNKVYNLVESNEKSITEFFSNKKFNQEFNNFDNILKVVYNKSSSKDFKNKTKDIDEALATNDFNVANKVSKTNNDNFSLRCEYFVYVLPLSKNIFTALGKGIDVNGNILSTVENHNVTNKEFNDIVYSAMPNTARTTFNSYKKDFFSTKITDSYTYKPFIKNMLSSIFLKKELNIVNSTCNINDLIKTIEEKFNKKVENKYNLIAKGKIKNARPDSEENENDISAIDTDIDFIEKDGNVIMQNDLNKNNNEYGKSFILIDISSLASLSNTNELNFKNATFDLHPVCFKSNITGKKIESALKESIKNKEIFISEENAFYTDALYSSIFKNNFLSGNVITRNNKKMILLKVSSAYQDSVNLMLYTRKLESLGYNKIKGFTFLIKLNFEIKNSINKNNNKNINIRKSINFNLNSNISNIMSFSSQLRLDENKNNTIQPVKIENIALEKSRLENKVLIENNNIKSSNKINSLNKQIV